MMGEDKMGIASILADSVFIGMSECEQYGMAWGCDEDCPVYQRGECKNEVTLTQLDYNKKKMRYDTKQTNTTGCIRSESCKC